MANNFYPTGFFPTGFWNDSFWPLGSDVIEIDIDEILLPGEIMREYSVNGSITRELEINGGLE